MLNAKTMTKALHLFADKVQANKDYLSELDTPIGDADHGGNMARGLTAVTEGLDKLDGADLMTVLKTTAMALISKVGGASGPLYGTAFLEMAKAAKTSDDLNVLLPAALAGIQKRGGAAVGDKTMVDVWTPLVAATAAGTLDQAAIDAAVEATAPLVAHKGRASYLGERSAGHLDPGSMSSGYFFSALLEAAGDRMSLGIVIVSHVPEIAAGVTRLLAEVAGDVPLTYAGGTDENAVGTDMAKISAAFEANAGDELLAFYDLGSAKMNLEMAAEFSDKAVHLYDVALVEGAYTAASLAAAGVDRAGIEAQLAPLKIK